MPHFVIEQGYALITAADRQRALQIAVQVGSDCGFINPADVKARLYDCEDYLFVDGCRSFIHVTIRLLAGRTAEKKEALSVSLRAALADEFPSIESISIEVCDMDPVTYKKRLSR